MVVKIQNSYSSMRGTLDYNEDKVSLSEAERIAAVNVDGPTLKEIQRTFEKYERWNIRSTNVSFQMSINPNLDAGEKMSDEKAIEFALRIMKELGYENQPIVIYKHEDIEREHYHVVSIRTDNKGKKIRDRQEENRLQRLLRGLEEEYGFKVGTEELRENEEISTSEEITPERPMPTTGLSARYLDAFDKAKEYHFRTFTQLKAIMSWYGIDVSKQEFERRDIVCLQAVDSDGRGCATPLKETELGRNLMGETTARTVECAEDRSRHLPLRREIATVVETCRNAAGSLEEFKELLKEKGLGLFLSRKRDGHIFGVTLVDHGNKIAFKGSEISKSLSPELIRDWEALSIVSPVEYHDGLTEDPSALAPPTSSVDIYDDGRTDITEDSSGESTPRTKVESEKNSEPAEQFIDFFGSLLDFMVPANQSMRDAPSTPGRDAGMDGQKNKGKKKKRK